VGRALVTVIASLGAALVLLDVEDAKACASCACGDPTITVMGSEKPFAERLRVSATFAMRSEESGEPSLDQIRSSEQRLDLAIAYSPWPWLQVGAGVPLVRKDVTLVNLENDVTFGLGDVELRAKAFVLSLPADHPEHLVALHAALELPTSRFLETPDGRPLPIEAQSGSGSIDPAVGLSYAYFAYPWSSYASVTVHVPTVGHDDVRGGTALLMSAAVQYQPDYAFGLQLGADARLDASETEAAGPDPNSGGLIGFLSPGIVVTPLTDLALHLTLRVPIVSALSGVHREGIMLSSGVAYDF
jgi:hypothetical protein